MENHPLYQKLSRILLDNDYTVDQVRSLNCSQAAELLETCSFSDTFLNNMKRKVVVILQNREDESFLLQLRQTAGAWLDANFPSWEAELESENGKPCVRIWLKGKP